MTDVKRILAIDIGGTGIKAAIVGPTGKFLTERLRVKTPDKGDAEGTARGADGLVTPLKDYDHISVGFPRLCAGWKSVHSAASGQQGLGGFRAGGGGRENIRRAHAAQQ